MREWAKVSRLETDSLAFTSTTDDRKTEHKVQRHPLKEDEHSRLLERQATNEKKATSSSSLLFPSSSCTG
jgi:hypothetical protein